MKNCVGKKTWLVGYALFIAGLCQADTITFVGDDWCPYTCQPNSDLPGYMVEIAQAALKPYGHKVVYEVLPWARAVPLVEKGDRSGVLGTDQLVTPGLVFPKTEQGYGRWGVYVKSGVNWRYTDTNSLQGRSIGLIKGYNYNEFSTFFEANPSAIKLDFSFGEEPLQANVRKLLVGRFNTLIENESVMAWYLNKTGETGKVVFAGHGSQFLTYAAFSPKHSMSAVYAQQLSDGMVAIRKSGQLAKIMARYGLEDWAPLTKRPLKP